MNIIKVSVIVPVYNGQKYLERAILSLLNQTLKEIEIIIVNDGSTDTTASIADGFAASDKRVRVIHLEKNMGLYEARLIGFESASGEYIAGCDADDYYSLNAMEKMYNKAKQSNADIVQGKTMWMYDDCIREEHFTKMNISKLESEDILSFIIENSKCWGICNKLINRKIFLKAILDYPRDVNLITAEDLLLFSVIAYNSNLQILVESETYFYNQTNTENSSACGSMKKERKRILDLIFVFKFLQTFLKKNRADLYSKLTKIIHNHFYCRFNQFPYSDIERSDLIYTWIESLSPEAIPIECFTENMINPKTFSTFLPKSKKQKVKTIGMFYTRYYNGGVERVMSELFSLFDRANYNLVLFTEKESNEKDYPLPNNVKRIFISTDFDKRFDAWRVAIEKYNIDLIIYHAWISLPMQYDVLFIRMLGVKTVCNFHGIFSVTTYVAELVWSQKHVLWYYVFDACVCLSEVDKHFWNCVGLKNIHYINNPLTCVSSKMDIAKLEGNTLLWLGRFENTQKQSLLAMEAFSRVLQKRSSAKFLIVGTGETPYETDLLHNRAKELNVYSACEFVGYQTDVMPYILRSDVHVMPSRSEGFPMVLGEVKSCGVPTVMFDLPYLEMTKDGLGVVKVPQGDVEALADAIIKILNNSEYKKQLGREAVQSLQPFINYDTVSAWELVFESINNPPPQPPVIDENVVLVVEELLRATLSLNEKYLVLASKNKDIRSKFACFLEAGNNNFDLFYNSLFPYFFSIIRNSRYLTIRIFGIKVTFKNKNNCGGVFVITSSQILRAIFSINLEDKRYIVLRLLGFKISIKHNFRQIKNDYNKS